MGLHESLHTVKQGKVTTKKICSCSKRRAAGLQFGRHATSKGFVVTTPATSGRELWRQATWCSGGSSLERAYTSSRRCGKGRSGSCTSHALERHAWRKKTTRLCPTHGTSSICGSSTRDATVKTTPGPLFMRVHWASHIAPQGRGKTRPQKWVPRSGEANSISRGSHKATTSSSNAPELTRDSAP